MKANPQAAWNASTDTDGATCCLPAEQVASDPLSTRVRAFLEDCQLAGLDSVQIETQQEVVVLTGFVASEADRFRFLDCCRCVGGVFQVVDCLELSPPAI